MTEVHVKWSKSLLINTGYRNLLHGCDFVCFNVMNYYYYFFYYFFLFFLLLLLLPSYNHNIHKRTRKKNKTKENKNKIKKGK